MEWRNAFRPGHTQMARRVADFLREEADWSCEIYDGCIHRIADYDDECIVDRGDHDSDEDVIDCFINETSSDLINRMNRMFGKPKPKVGQATRLPLPKDVKPQPPAPAP